MAVGEREFGELLQRVQSLTDALDAALPALVRRDVCDLRERAVERRLTVLEEDRAGRQAAETAARAQVRAAWVAAAAALVAALIGAGAAVAAGVLAR